jgi:hypothetical protein
LKLDPLLRRWPLRRKSCTMLLVTCTLLVAICAVIASLPPAYADSCMERARAVNAGKIPAGQDDPDCTPSGRVSGEASGGIIGAAITGLVGALTSLMGGGTASAQELPSDFGKGLRPAWGQMERKAVPTAATYGYGESRQPRRPLDEDEQIWWKKAQEKFKDAEYMRQQAANEESWANIWRYTRNTAITADAVGLIIVAICLLA